MPKYVINTANGEVKVEGRKFAFYLNNVRYWFFVHQIDGHIGWRVSELETGRSVRDIAFQTIAACASDIVSAAKLTLRQLIDKVGEDRVKVVIDSAPKLTKYKEAA